MRHLLKHPAAIYLAFFTAAITPLLLFTSGTADAQENAERRAPSVTVTTAKISTVVARSAVSGTVVAAEEVLVNTRINGYAIESILVDIGDTVQRGEVLAVLDDASPGAQLAQAEAELVRSQASIGQAQSQIDAAQASRSEARSALTRIRRLRESGNVSQSTLDEAIAAATTASANLSSAQSGLTVAQAQQVSALSQRDAAQLTVDRTEIRSPVSGIVARKNAQLGQIASSSGEPLFTVIRDGNLEIVVDVVESNLVGIDVGDSADFRVSSVGTVAGAVRLVSPTVNEQTRLAQVYVTLPDTANLRAGLSASGWITSEERESVTVPSTAIINNGLLTSVNTVVDSAVVSVEVVAGVLSSNGQREIIRGLSEGDIVIARAGSFFIDGDAVTPVQEDSAETNGDDTLTDEMSKEEASQ